MGGHINRFKNELGNEGPYSKTNVYTFIPVGGWPRQLACLGASWHRRLINPTLLLERISVGCRFHIMPGRTNSLQFLPFENGTVLLVFAVSRITSYESIGHAYFITFSCYKRRRLLDHDAAKEITLEVLASQLSRRNARCQGFVIMPDHVHALVWFSVSNELSQFMKQWKRLSSYKIKKNLVNKQIQYARKISFDEPIWQHRYYAFNIYSEHKLMEKLVYMHNNPVKAGFVNKPEEWAYSSARHYLLEQPVGVPMEMPG